MEELKAYLEELSVKDGWLDIDLEDCTIYDLSGGNEEGNR